MRDSEKSIKLCSEEVHLIELIREVKYGEICIHIQNGKPIRVEEVRKSIVLDSPK